LFDIWTLKFGFGRKEVMPMTQSRTRILYPSPLKIRGARGVMKEFAKGKRTMPGPGSNPLPSFLALDGRGLR
jgi:hypothetical protein